MNIQNFIEQLINAAEKSTSDKDFPENLANKLIFYPETVLELLPYYIEIDKKNAKRAAACLWLIAKCLDQLRYNLDKKSPKAEELFYVLQTIIPVILSRCTTDNRPHLNSVIYESLLPFSFSNTIDLAESSGSESLDILPKLPEFLEKIKRENQIRSSFDLYDGLMSQMQTISLDMQLMMVSELAATKKSMPHEVAILLTLHVKAEVRENVSAVLMRHIDDNTFTSLDLRRLIVIRNWLLPNERTPMDALIKALKIKGVSPAPYPLVKIITIMASAFDGAGAQLIAFSVKCDSSRIIGGFILKQGVGIREPWVRLKSSKGELEHMLESSELVLKPVNIAYVNKAVRHFIAEGHQKNNVPTAVFLQISELLGVTEWQPELLNFSTEINRLSSMLESDQKSSDGIKVSLLRSASWIHTEPFFRYWFECGDEVQSFIMKAMDSSKAMTRKKAESLKALVTKEIIQPSLAKWKVIIMFTCLWARSKTLDNPLWMDLLILLELIDSGTLLTEIPAINNISSQSIAATFGQLEE